MNSLVDLGLALAIGLQIPAGIAIGLLVAKLTAVRRRVRETRELRIRLLQDPEFEMAKRDVLKKYGVFLSSCKKLNTLCSKPVLSMQH